MTRKDFIKVAEIVALARGMGEGSVDRREGCGRIDELLRESNENYNAVRFWLAVGDYK